VGFGILDSIIRKQMREQTGKLFNAQKDLMEALDDAADSIEKSFEKVSKSQDNLAKEMRAHGIILQNIIKELKLLESK